jgi:hypothetical protein
VDATKSFDDTNRILKQGISAYLDHE